jgi:hypothetical protein
LKKTSKKVILISVASFCIFLIIGALIIITKLGDENKKSYIDFKKKDYYNFQSIGEYIFNKMDALQYKVGFEYYIESYAYSDREVLYLNDNNINNILQKYDIVSVFIIDKDIIIFNCGAYFQQAGGVIITRNSAVPKTIYKDRGFDGNKINLNKIDKGIYSYTAGL